MFKCILVAEGKVVNNAYLQEPVRSCGCIAGSLIPASDTETGAMERKRWNYPWIGMTKWGRGAMNFAEMPTSVRAKVCSRDCALSVTCVDFLVRPFTKYSY